MGRVRQREEEARRMTVASREAERVERQKREQGPGKVTGRAAAWSQDHGQIGLKSERNSSQKVQHIMCFGHSA